MWACSPHNYLNYGVGDRKKKPNASHEASKSD